MRAFKVLALLLFLIILAGCGNSEEKVGPAAMEDLESYYNLNDIDVVSTEYDEPQVPFLIFALDYILNGKDYDVLLRVNEAVPVEVTGYVNARELIFRNENYFIAKHAALLKSDLQYKEIIDTLSDLGVEELTVSDEYFDEETRTIIFKMNLVNVDILAEQLATYLDLLANMLLDNIETNISIEIETAANDTYFERINQEDIEIKIPAHDNNESREIVQTIEEQLAVIRSADKITKDLMEELEAYNLAIATSQIHHVDIERDLIEHEMYVSVEANYNVEEVLKGFQYLQSEGLDNTSVKLLFEEGRTGFVEVNKIETVEDVERYYIDVIEPRDEASD